MSKTGKLVSALQTQIVANEGLVDDPADMTVTL